MVPSSSGTCSFHGVPHPKPCERAGGDHGPIPPGSSTSGRLSLWDHRSAFAGAKSLQIRMTPLGAHSAGGSNVGLGIACPGCPLPLIEAPGVIGYASNQRCSAGLRVIVRYAPSAGLGRGWGRRRLLQPDWRGKHEAVDFRRLVCRETRGNRCAPRPANRIHLA